jgi:hypothetical protein
MLHLTTKFLGVAKFTTLTSLSLLISCELLFIRSLRFLQNSVKRTGDIINTAFDLILVHWACNANQPTKHAFIADLPYLPVQEDMVIMWHLWLVVKLGECGEDFQIFVPALLQILRNFHGRAPTIGADSKFLLNFFTLTKFHYNEFILAVYNLVS